MLVLGEIKEVKEIKQHTRYRVRIPIFETAGGGEVILDNAVACTIPGICVDYTQGDVVVLGFELNRVSYPIILGKLYQGAVNEAKENRGEVHTKKLQASDSADLPENLKIDGENFATNITELIRKSFTGPGTYYN